MEVEWEVQRPLESASGTILIIKAQSGSSIAPMQSWLVNSTVIAVLQLPRSSSSPPPAAGWPHRSWWWVVQYGEGTFFCYKEP